MKRWMTLIAALAVLLVAAAPLLAADEPKTAPAPTDTKKADEPKVAPKAVETKAAPVATETKAAPAATDTKAAPAATDTKAAATGTDAKATPTSTAADAKKEEEARKADLDQLVSTMAREAKLTDEQKTTLAKVATAAMAAMEDFRKTNEAIIDKFQKAAAAAQAKGDRDAFQKALDEAKPVLEKGQALSKKSEDDVMNVLTADQKVLWQGYQLSLELTANLKRFGLSDEQNTKLRTLCNATVKDLEAVKGEDEVAFKARQTLFAKMENDIKTTILTAEQRAAIEKPPALPPGATFELPPMDKPATEKPAAEKTAPAAEKPAATKPAAETPAATPAKG